MRLILLLITCLGAVPLAAQPDGPFPESLSGGALLFREALVPVGYKLVYEQEFSAPDSLGHFVMTDPDAWRLSREDGGFVLEQYRQSEYAPEVRSPVNIALLADRLFGDFVLEVDARSTTREYGHRDLCFFFGSVGPSQFYYVHLASAADDRAHNIFIVNKKDREKIGEAATPGVEWGKDQWHKVRIERNIEAGTIKVFFNDITHPVMTAQDRTFRVGHIGFGSFDDTGQFDHIRIWAPVVRERKTGYYRAPER